MLLPLPLQSLLLTFIYPLLSKQPHPLLITRLTLIATISIFSTLTSGFAPSDHPGLFHPTDALGVSRRNGTQWPWSFSDSFSPPAPEHAISASPISSWQPEVVECTGLVLVGTLLPGIPGIFGLIEIFIGESFWFRVLPRAAVVVEDFWLKFPCPATTKRGYGVAPVWENDYVTRDTTKGGFIVTCG